MKPIPFPSITGTVFFVFLCFGFLKVASLLNRKEKYERKFSDLWPQGLARFMPHVHTVYFSEGSSSYDLV